MSSPLKAILPVVLVAAAATLGFGVYRWYAASDARQLATQTPPAAGLRVESEPSPTPEAAARKMTATRPEFALRDRAGTLRSIKEWDGKSLVINFWATWCAPCRREIPMLRELHRARAAQDVAVIGIAVDFRDQVLAYADKMRIDYPILIGEQDALDAIEAFGVDAVGFPFTIFTDRQGRIVTAHLGELHRPEADLILDTVAAINAGTVSLAQGQERIANGLAQSGRSNATG